MYPLNPPAGFVPEAHGWVEDFGLDHRGIRVWTRWEPPWLFPAVISLWEWPDGIARGWYGPASQTREPLSHRRIVEDVTRSPQGRSPEREP